MPFPALLWIALLHAFSLATAWTAVRRDHVGGAVARVAGTVRESTPAHCNGTTADVPESEVRAPLRVSLRVSGVSAWRLSPPVPHAKGRSPRALATGRHPVQAPSAQCRVERGVGTHRLESGGTILPYFPTAPPQKA